MALGEQRFPLVAILFFVSPYTLWFAVKLDHNSILLTVWSLFAWAFLFALREPNLRRGLILGLAAPLALYAKYISLMLLVSSLLATIISPRREALFKSPVPYVAVTFCALLFAPHIWQAAFADKMSNVAFALQPLGEVGSLPKHMLWNNFINSVPVMIAFALLYFRYGPASGALFQDYARTRNRRAAPYVLIVAANSWFGFRGAHGDDADIRFSADTVGKPVWWR